MTKKLTKKEFEKKVYELIQTIKDKTTSFPNDTVEKQIQRKKKALSDFFFFAQTYFPHYVDKPFGSFHKEMYSYTELERHIIAIAGPRAHGKTVLLAIIKPIWKALKEQKKFIVFVSDNEDLATERTIAIQVEFLHNKRIKQDFGEQLKFGQGEESDFVISAGCRFLALGYKQPIRGKLFGHYRPDYIVIDDFESHNSRNPKIARNKLDYVREEAFGALPQNTGIIIWLANLTHKDSAIAYFKKIVDEEKPKGLIFLLYKAILPNGEPLWKEGYTIQELNDMRDVMGNVGFERHMMMNPITEGVKFKAKWFKYYTLYTNSYEENYILLYENSYEENLKDNFRKVSDVQRIVTYCDPSLGSKSSSDYKAIITLALAKKRYYILDAWIRKASILQMLEKLYQLDQTYTTRIYMESNFWQKILWDFIPELSEKYGYLLPVSGIENKQKKTERIEAITPFYEWGWIYHYTPKDEDIILLEEQLLGFPDHPNDDAPDALAGAIAQMKFISAKKEYKSQKRMATKFNRLI